MPLYLEDFDAWFVHVPKTGGTWVAAALEKIGVRSQWIGSIIKRSEHPTPHTLPGFNRDRAFAFVRHPVSWYESWWRFRQQKWTPLDGAEVPELLACIDGCKDATVDGFMENVGHHQPALVTRLYEWMIGPVGWENVKYVGRQENLARDLAGILGELGHKIDLGDMLAAFNSMDRENVSQGPKRSLDYLHRLRVGRLERATIDRWYGGKREPNRINFEELGYWVRRTT